MIISILKMSIFLGQEEPTDLCMIIQKKVNKPLRWRALWRKMVLSLGKVVIETNFFIKYYKLLNSLRANLPVS